MRECKNFYIDGQWLDPVELNVQDVENPATERVCGHIALASAADVDRAVMAARQAFSSWSRSSREERLELFENIRAEYQKRYADLAAAVTEEMGAPAAMSRDVQVGICLGHLETTINILKSFPFEEQRGTTLITREPIGVCGLITPWNWPLNQVVVKVFPALATGCTMVLKPSEVSPFSAQIFTEVLDAAGVPAGVFNMVQGDGADAGAALSAHPEVDMISFTGSVRAGVEIAKTAATTVKRVTQELGGKSPSIILDDDRFADNVAGGVASMMGNTGQTCVAPSRMLVPASRLAEAVAIARESAARVTVGDPGGDYTMGPLASRMQFDKVQQLIQRGIDEGASVVAGGVGRPDGLLTGYYAKPTVFADVDNDMTIAREEIFGPVLVIIAYNSVDEAIRIANDTDYGLAAYVMGADLDMARDVARQLRAGSVTINRGFDFMAPFGGYKKSGNGREWGEFGFHDYLEIKGIRGYAAQ